ncbi:hypothetical protein PR002_g26822 [Phytophthora rubi]|uniref:Uncharacterized protein n=1 Tax=Phytophthora rubi TaxID=129364 RepID=A0A6A3HTU5_9STRA|nr:hypothetical protein PR002_g26822 [Phytophthora rubi]
MEPVTPAGISRCLFDGKARLLNEAMVGLSNLQGNSDDEPHGMQAVGGPTENLYIPGREWREFRLPRRQPPLSTHEVWIRRSETLVLTITKFRRGRPTWVRLTNMSPKGTRCSTHVPVVLWMLKGKLPNEPGYTRLDSDKYRDWQVLAYAISRNETFFGREQQRYERYVAEQPSAVDRRDYPTPRKILTRATEALRSADECRITSVELTGLAPAVTDDLAGPGVHKPSVVGQEDAMGHDDSEPTSSEDLNADGPAADTGGSGDGGISPTDGSAKPFKHTQGFKTSGAVEVDRSRDGDEDYVPSEGWNDFGAAPTRSDTSDYPDGGATDATERLLDARYASVVDAMPPEYLICDEADATDTFKQRPNETEPMENLENETKLTGYGDKSAFIPDSSETMLTYSEPIGQSRGMDAIQREILIMNGPTPPVCNRRVMGQMTTKGSHRSGALWILLLWTVVIAANAYLEGKAVTLVGYTGMRNGVSAALEPKTEALTHRRPLSRFCWDKKNLGGKCRFKPYRWLG